MRIALANDHAGTDLKNQIKEWLESQGHEVADFGTHGTQSCDLSDYVLPAALSVAAGECACGIFVDGVGYGSAMIANKVRGIFACVCQDPVCAQLARQHNDANVLCLGGKLIGPVLAMATVKAWMAEEPLDAEKYVRRRAKVAEIDRSYTKPLGSQD